MSHITWILTFFHTHKLPSWVIFLSSSSPKCCQLPCSMKDLKFTSSLWNFLKCHWYLSKTRTFCLFSLWKDEPLLYLYLYLYQKWCPSLGFTLLLICIIWKEKTYCYWLQYSWSLFDHQNNFFPHILFPLST